MEGEIWEAIEGKDIRGLVNLLSPSRDSSGVACSFPGSCVYREESACLYQGDEGTCPIVIGWKRGESQ